MNNYWIFIRMMVGYILLRKWEKQGLVKPFHTENGKHKLYPKHRLIELYEMHICL